MKKKFLLGILPVLLALSACSAKPIENANIYVEDALAHEELFGDENKPNEYELGQSRGLQPRRAFVDRSLDNPDPDPLTKPVVGVQYQALTNGYYALRFVAAIATLNVDAVWTRNICESNGNRRKTDNSQIQVTKAYRELSIDGGVGLPETFGTEFHYFVVYTLKNIPEADLNSYLFGYLTITYQETSVKSDARIAKVDGGHTFTIDTDATSGYFIQGYMRNSTRIVPITATPSSGSNYAEQEDLQLNSSDWFGLFKYQPGNDEHFQCFGYNQLRRGAQFFTRNASKNCMIVPGSGNYKLYLTHSNEVHIVVPDSGKFYTKLYFKPGNSWGTSARYALNVFNNNAEPATQTWMPLSQIGNTGIYTCDAFNGNNWPECQLVRLNPSTTTYNWDGDWWSKTGNLSTSDIGNIFYVNNDASQERQYDAQGNWNLYIPA